MRTELSWLQKPLLFPLHDAKASGLSRPVLLSLHDWRHTFNRWERVQLWLYSEVQYSPMCRQLVMSLIITSIQPTEKTSPDLESGKIKALSRYWHKLVQHLISSLNSSLKARGGIISLLIDEETEPQKAEMTYVASCKVVTEMGRDPWPLDPSFSLLIKTFHIKCKVL